MNPNIKTRQDRTHSLPPEMVRALFLLEEDNAARQMMLWLCTHRWFDTAILAVILFNACMMATEDPTQPDLVDPTTDSLELACNVIFTMEMTVKIFAYGFVIGEQTYLRSGWNVLVRPNAPQFTSAKCSLPAEGVHVGMIGVVGFRNRCIGVDTIFYQQRRWDGGTTHFPGATATSHDLSIPRPEKPCSDHLHGSTAAPTAANCRESVFCHFRCRWDTAVEREVSATLSGTNRQLSILLPG